MPKVTQLSKLMRSRRSDLGVTQQDLATKLKVHVQFVSNIERGICSIPPKRIRALARALKVEPKQIVEVILNDYRYQLERGIK